MSEPERAAAIELFYRDVNERIRSVGSDLLSLSPADELSVLCECKQPTCAERLQVSVETYRRVRESPERFMVLPGHESGDVDRVVERHENFVVVEKDPELIAEAEERLPDE